MFKHRLARGGGLQGRGTVPYSYAYDWRQGGGPPALRSELHPLGLLNLSVLHPHEAPRVEAANILYQFVADCVMILLECEVAWPIENPANSLLWWFPSSPSSS